MSRTIKKIKSESEQLPIEPIGLVLEKTKATTVLDLETEDFKKNSTADLKEIELHKTEAFVTPFEFVQSKEIIILFFFVLLISCFAFLIFY